MEIRAERQQSPVAEQVSALIAVTRPILVGLLHSIGEQYLEPHGGRHKIVLKQLGRVRKANDGDMGVAFEYAIHDAILNENSVVMERVSDALKRCKISGSDPSSILFAIEKSGAKQLVETKRELITPYSQVLSGKQGRPVKLHGYMNQLAAAFHRKGTGVYLPSSIKGLWKADLFLGSTGPDNWVGASVRVNGKLEAAPGLRIAIVPSTRTADAIRKDESKNLIICPIPHDYSFMQTFHEGMRIIQALVGNDFTAPSLALLPDPRHREVARAYVERRNFPVSEVLEAVKSFAQPHLLETDTDRGTTATFESSEDPMTSTLVGPLPILHA